MREVVRRSSDCSIRTNVKPWPRSTRMIDIFAVGSSWNGTASGAAGTTTFRIRYQHWWRNCDRASILACNRSPTDGTQPWGSTFASRRSTANSSTAAMRRGNFDLHRCCCSMAPTTTTACTRISTESTCFRCNSRSCSPQPSRDFTGGEFVLTEQRPRMQSRPEVVSLRQGDAVIFAVRHRPVQGTRGVYRVNLRHGVSRVRSGLRRTLGVIFHDGN